MLADVLHKVAALDQDDDHPYHPRPSLASPETADDPGRCIRQLVYYRTGEPAAPLPGRAVLIFDDGHWHEELTADWITKTAQQLHSRQLGVDVPLPQPIGIPYTCSVCQQSISRDRLHGHIDGLITDLLAVTRLLELKAINHFSYQEALEGRPPIDYLTQSCVYLSGLQRLQPAIREGLLLIKNKNTAAYLEFRFAYDPGADRCQLIELVASDGTFLPLDWALDGLVGSALGKFARVEEYAAAHTLPARPYRADHWRCAYCRWTRSCWGAYAAEVARRDPAVPLDPCLAPLLAQYAQAAAAKTEAEATTKRLRPRILGALEATNARVGIADGYQARVDLQQRTTLDTTLLPPAVRHAAEVKKPVEVLHVESRSRPPHLMPTQASLPAESGLARVAASTSP